MWPFRRRDTVSAAWLTEQDRKEGREGFDSVVRWLKSEQIAQRKAEMRRRVAVWRERMRETKSA